ncbi:hypothetical protein B7P43_G07121, partial [Cryptotermes secundus]
ILTEDLSMRKVCTKMVSKELTTFFSVPEDKINIARRHFDDIDDIRNNTTAALKVTPQNQFQNCFEGWTRSWDRCIASQGECFEGDHSDIHQRDM